MRRTDREITDFNTMLEAVKACDCFRIGLVDDEGMAYIVPVNFGHIAGEDKLTLYFHGASEGKKIELIKKQPMISFEMDTGHVLKPRDAGCGYSFAFKCVMGKGRITILEDIEDKIEAFRAIFAQFTDRQDIVFNKERIMATTVFKVDVTEWSCKFHE